MLTNCINTLDIQILLLQMHTYAHLQSTRFKNKVFSLIGNTINSIPPFRTIGAKSGGGGLSHLTICEADPKMYLNVPNKHSLAHFRYETVHVVLEQCKIVLFQQTLADNSLVKSGLSVALGDT